MNALELKSAGFTDDEILAHVDAKIPGLKAAGFNDSEISNYFGPLPVREKPRELQQVEPPPFDFDKVFADPISAIQGPQDPPIHEDVSRSLFPLVKPFLAQGYTAASAINRGMASFSTHLDIIGDYVNEKTGGILSKGGLFKEASRVYEENADYWKKRADEIGVDFIDELVGEAVGGAAPGIGEFILNIPYSTLLGAAEAGRKGQSELAGALVEGAKRGVLGAMFKATEPLKQYLRSPLMGGVFAAQTAGEGGSARDIAKAAGTGALYSLSSPGGQMGLNDIRANLKKEMVKMEAERPRVEPTFEEKPEEAPSPPLSEAPPKPPLEPQVKPAESIPLNDKMIRDFNLDKNDIETLKAIWKQDPNEFNKLISSYKDEMIRNYEMQRVAKTRQMSDEDMFAEQKVEPGLFGPKPKKGEPSTFISWVKKQGGIWDTSLMGETQQYSSKESGIVGLLNQKKGRFLDELTELAKEAGYLGPAAGVNDFMRELDRDIRISKGSIKGDRVWPGAMVFAPPEGFRRESSFAPKTGDFVEFDYEGRTIKGKIRDVDEVGKTAWVMNRDPSTPKMADNQTTVVNLANIRPVKPAGGGTAAFAPEAGFRRDPQVGEPQRVWHPEDLEHRWEVPIKEGEITSRAEILKFLREKLDIPIRTGRFRDKALGIFKPGAGVIRTRNFADIEVVAHEAGHALQKFFWPESMADAKHEPPLGAYAAELNSISSEPKPGQSRLAEGFAEFIRLYITNEPQAREKAPTFYNHFEHLLDTKSPESKEIFLQARYMFDKYMRQPAYQRVRSQMSIGEENRAKKFTLDDLYTMALDEFHPLKMVEKEISGKEKIPVGYSPYNLARMLNGGIGKANHFLKFKTFDFNNYKNVGKSLEDILKPAADRLENLSVYMVARRVPELAKRGIDVGISEKDAREVVNKFDSEPIGEKGIEAHFTNIFNNLEEYQNQLLRYMRDAGILSPESYKTIVTVSKDYDPFYRIFEEEPGKPRGGLGKGLQAWNPVREIKGGWQRIQDPLESIIKNTMLYINLAERNAVGKALVDMGKKEGAGKFIEEIPAPKYPENIKPEEIFRPQELEAMKKAGIEPQPFYTVFRPGAFTQRENVISVWIDGQQRDFQVGSDVYRTFKALDREGANAIEKLISIPAKWLRAGSVLTPEFLARNPFRDQFSAFVNSKYGFVPGVDLMRGIFHLFKKDDVYWEWQKSGAAQSTLAAMDREYFQNKMGEILKGYPIVNLIKNPVEALRALGEIGEVGTRLGEFAKGLEKEGTTKKGIQAAGFAAREVTTDFQRIGAKTRALNSIIAFWNAGVQSVDREVRAFQENPMNATLKSMAAITLPSLLLAWVNHDDPRYWEIPQWQRDLCWVIFPNHMSKEKWEGMTPQEKADEVKWITGAAWRFPKPWELGIIFGTIPERVAHYIATKDPQAFNQVWESVGRTLSPGVIPTTLVPWLENKANYSFFFDRKIVPPGREDLPPQYQYGPWTTDAAKALGQVMGKLPYIERTDIASPAKVENLVRGWTGGLGYYALQLASAGLTAAGIAEKGPEKPAASFADIPFVKAFAVRYPSSSAESIQKFYDNHKEAAGINKAVKSLITKEFKVEKGLQLMVENTEIALDGHYRALGSLHDFIESVYNNPSMTPNEKREFVDISYFQMIDIARNGNEMVRTLKEQMKQLKTAEKTKPSGAGIPQTVRSEKPDQRALRPGDLFR